jgi:hypothetical protein
MMTGVSALMAMRGARFWIRAGSSALALAIIAAGGLAVWYRSVYNVWPGMGASARVHWCGRDYQYSGDPAQSWRQISSQAQWPIHAVGLYPPLGWSRQELFAATYPQALRSSASCATVVYLRTGPDEYRVYGLEGGP